MAPKSGRFRQDPSYHGCRKTILTEGAPKGAMLVCNSVMVDLKLCISSYAMTGVRNWRAIGLVMHKLQ